MLSNFHLAAMITEGLLAGDLIRTRSDQQSCEVECSLANLGIIKSPLCDDTLKDGLLRLANEDNARRWLASFNRKPLNEKV